MTTLITILKSPMLVLSAALFSWFSVKQVPTPMMLFWLAMAVFVDLITGLIKAWSRKICTTSQGLRETIVKIGTYSMTVVMVVILVNMAAIIDVNNKYNLSILIDSLIGFMVFIELYSICENISAAYPGTPLTIYMINPILKFLKGKLKRNPITGIGKEDKSKKHSDETTN